MTQATRGIGIEFISAFGMPPVEFVGLAADLGCTHVGIGLAPDGENPQGYPKWSMREDAGLRREFRAALEERGIALSIGEVFLALPGAPVENLLPDLDLMAELGVPVANVVSLDPDTQHAYATLSRFADLARERDMSVTLEFLPGLPIPDLASARQALAQIGHPDLRLLIDAMHVFRTGGTVADVAALERCEVGHVQICDVPLPTGDLPYAQEARYERRAPGQGDIPLRELLEVLPEDLIIGLEVPELSKAKAGIGPRERLGPCVEATRALIEEIATASS